MYSPVFPENDLINFTWEHGWGYLMRCYKLGVDGEHQDFYQWSIYFNISEEGRNGYKIAESAYFANRPTALEHLISFMSALDTEYLFKVLCHYCTQLSNIQTIIINCNKVDMELKTE